MNLTVLLPGSSMISKQECLKELKVEVKDKKGNVVKDKQGNIKYTFKTVPDPTKHNAHSVRVNYDGKTEVINYYTRKCVPAKQVINISSVAYKNFISNTGPDSFYAPSGFEPYKSLKKMALRDQAWNALTDEQKLLWHCKEIAANLGGTVLDFTVFPD